MLALLKIPRKSFDDREFFDTGLEQTVGQLVIWFVGSLVHYGDDRWL